VPAVHVEDSQSAEISHGSPISHFGKTVMQ